MTKICLFKSTHPTQQIPEGQKDLSGPKTHERLYQLTLFKQIQCSGQQIESFQKLQIESSITIPLAIPLHSNIRWGSAFNMLDRTSVLDQVLVAHTLSFSQ
jgi:hypothetical protein